MSTTTNTFKIAEHRLPGLLAKIEKLNKRARKLGVDEIVVGAGEAFGEEHPVLEGVVETYVMVTVDGTSPKLNGYKFVATLEHVDGDVMLRTSPEFEGDLPKHFRSADPYNCDHCHTRRTRNETFVLQHDSGEFKQIGRNCLQDFLGGVSAQTLAARAELLFSACELASSEESEGGGGGSRSTTHLNTLTFLGMVALHVRKLGWTSRSAAGEGGRATVDGVLEVMFCRDAEMRRQYLRDGLGMGNVEDADVSTAEAALAWARNTFGGKAPNDRSDFEHNMATATKNDAFTMKSAGIVAYVIAGHAKAMERELARKLEAENLSASEHFGEVGKRTDFYARLIGLASFDGMYGTTWIHRFLTRDGNVVVWFASNRPTFSMVKDGEGMRQTTSADVEAINTRALSCCEVAVEVGEKEYLITGTVKKHDVRNGVKQTVMNRCTLWTDEGRVNNEIKLAKKAASEAKKAAKAAAKAAKEAA